MGLSAAVAHDAGLSASGQVIQATFALEKPGDLVMPQLKTAFRTTSRPAQGLLDLFTFLSSSLCFTLYIRPSDYACEGLKHVSNLLNHDTLNESRQRRADGGEPPPQYSSAPSILVRTSSTPRSPSAFSDHPSLLVQETPSGSPGLLPISKDPKYQDELAIEIGLWAARAVDANIMAYQDARIEPLIAEMGRSARAGDITAFIAARARCSANFFFFFGDDGEDARSDEYEIDQDGAAQVYIRDLERLLAWILNKSRLGDLTLWAEFMKLGVAARAAVARPEVHKEYNARKGFCIGWAAVAIDLERRSPAL